jgi:mono/diheme cytochrome c family protein
MKENEQQEYLEKYRQAKEKGVPFFPDVLFKDAVVALLIFVLLVALAYFRGAPLEARADPADTSYTPRPEWYFLFLFQLLKYFPGQLEVLGVVVIPTLAILLLFGLPFLDRNSRRHFSRRPVVTGITALALLGVVGLTIQSARETPPLKEAVVGDETAALYTQNCSGCHGASIQVAAGTNLHAVIAEGKHEGMPAWSADLTSDQIDALAGFILSPGGSQLFVQNCSACHAAEELVAGDPLTLKSALEQGSDYPPHIGVELPDSRATLTSEERADLLNFLVAPDGQRLFAINCAACHGRAAAFSGDESALRTIIAEGGQHLDMPPWQEKLNEEELTTLAAFVTDPAQVPEGEDLFAENCSRCHGERVPAAADAEKARQVIASGGAHETMPVWGSILTAEQLDALVSYTLNASRGTSLEVGQELFAQNCATCHGSFGEGGANPTRPDDVIAPISTGEYLRTRDDFTLRAIISQGQPNFGMSPFGTASGGPLEEEEVDAIVAFMRTWEENPPVELPPEVSVSTVSLEGAEIYRELCAQCHGPDGDGGIGPALSDPTFQDANTDEDIFDTINLGHDATAMIGWGEILSAEQIQQLVEMIRQLEQAPVETPASTPVETQPATGAPTFTADVLPIFDAKCKMCHGTLGGWDGSTYASVMNSGDHAPVVIPGDAEGSLLVQKLLGTQAEGTIMPPAGKLPDDEIQIIIDWVAGGAAEK